MLLLKLWCLFIIIVVNCKMERRLIINVAPLTYVEDEPLAAKVKSVTTGRSIAQMILRTNEPQLPFLVGGFEDVNNDFPYTVTLENKRSDRICTGTLLKPTWVLTAAHCIKNENKVEKIRYGDFEVPAENTTKFSNILKYIRHPSIYPQLHDIALLKIKPVPCSHVKLSSVDYKSVIGNEGVVAGFSLYRNKFTRVAQRPLQFLRVLIANCPEQTSKLNKGPYLCLASKCGNISFAYKGDSGGPLLHDGRQIGVASLYLHSFAGVYTPVSPYLDWIRYNIVTN